MVSDEEKNEKTTFQITKGTFRELERERDRLDLERPRSVGTWNRVIEILVGRSQELRGRLKELTELRKAKAESSTQWAARVGVRRCRHGLGDCGAPADSDRPHWCDDAELCGYWRPDEDYKRGKKSAPASTTRPPMTREECFRLGIRYRKPKPACRHGGGLCDATPAYHRSCVKENLNEADVCDCFIRDSRKPAKTNHR